MWPFSRQAPAVVEKSLAEPTPEEIEIFTGVPIGSHALGLHQALTVPAVQRAIALISGSIAAFDIIVERRVAGGWESDSNHPVAELLADQPNDWQSTGDLVRDVIATALTNDRGGLAWVNRPNDRPVEIIRYEPGHYTIDYATDGTAQPVFRINNQLIDPADIIHLRGPFSRSPLTLAAEAIGVAKAMETHAGNLFRRGARPGGIIETPKTIGDEGVKKMLAGWRAAHEGADNSGKTAVLWDGAKWAQMTLSSTDAQFLELRKEQVIDIARGFNVPPAFLFELGRATWGNFEQQSKTFLSGLEIWMGPLEAAMRRALFAADERRDYRIRFDRDDFSAVDLTARATAISSLVSSRVINPNEGRPWVANGLAPYEGGDEFVNPNTGASQPGEKPETVDSEEEDSNED